jgi:hypothetical protein
MNVKEMLNTIKILKERESKGFQSCGFKIVDVMGKYYSSLPRDFIRDIEKVFDTHSITAE